MKSLLAIIKLTCKSAVRSHIFQLLLVLLILCIILVPNTISGDGTAWGYIQISLKYSLGVISFVLSLSTVWLGCFALTRDVENYQIHMVITKPVSRVTVWLGKCLGVILINMLLLMISCGIVYFFIIWQFSRQNFSKGERSRITNEVLVGRRVYYPAMPNIGELAKAEYRKRLEAARSSGTPMPETPEQVKKTLRELRKNVIAGMAEVRFGPSASRVWEYKGLPKNLKEPLFLRYRAYIDKISSSDQRETYGAWAVKVNIPDRELEKNKPKNIFEQQKQKEIMKSFFVPKTNYPEQIMCGVFNEFVLQPDVISPEGTVSVAFTNIDPQGKPLFFQVSDGPKLLIKESGFFSNYCRAVFVILLRIIILAGLACAAGSVLSMPTAIFTVISYLLFGSFAGFLVGTEIDMPGVEFTDVMAYYVSRVLLIIIIPMQNFEMSHLISNGELVEFSYIGRIFFQYFILRGLPLFLIGIWLYWRREMGLVIRK